jgi:hypothetical protein
MEGMSDEMKLFAGDFMKSMMSININLERLTTELKSLSEELKLRAKQ